MPAGVTRFKGIVGDARALGVSYEHLWYVLSGKRKSDSLTRRYRILKTSGQIEPRRSSGIKHE